MTDNFSKNELKNKNYVKPKGDADSVPLFGKLDNTHRTEGDLVLMDGFKTVVCPIIREGKTYNPSKMYFAVGDHRPFNAGDRVLVDCIDGSGKGVSAVRRILKKDKNVLWLKDALTHHPKMGGDVYKVIGTSQEIIRTVRR